MMTSSPLIIFYFSGTGNSINVARWMALAAEQCHTECSIFNIAEPERITDLQIPDTSLIIFVSPVHGFNYPPVMQRFIRRFPKGKNKVVLMDTRAGVLIGNFNLPGISGAAFIWSSLILKIKGYSIAGTKSVDLPSNWISLHPGLSQKSILKLHERHKLRVMEFAGKILNGQHVYISFFEFIVDLIIAPVAPAYYLGGRFFFAKTFYTSSDCNDCNLCITNCPVKAIIKVDNRPYWTFRCESCMRCMSSCPKRSIETAHGIAIVYCIFSSALTGLILGYFDKWVIEISNGFLRYILDTALFLLFFGILYRILHYLMRFRFFERIMVYTSFTRYRFWGKRYRALKNF